MSELINSVNHRFAPCLSVCLSLTSQLAELSLVVSAQGQHLDVTEWQTTIANNTGTHTAETLTTLEESVCQLWARQPLTESEAEFSPRINVLDSNNGGPTSIAHFKITFKQVFDPKTVTVGSIMPGIISPKKEGSKSWETFIKIEQVNRYTNQMVNWKWVMAAPVCQLKPVPP
ncbi:hypothetical protein DSO57_1025381 [Entomophthora muscae]|uniref:Uncharacterized protein n=1 Tax=Entomophthora muscae TaxID=34485 RepID=A0ACC2RH12_9FUNG|nr:hypothetical protein DSO57_1025381 [Entomophthora muscae]